MKLPPWVVTLIGAVTAVLGYLSSPPVLNTLPANWAGIIAGLGVVVGAIGQVLQQMQTHAVAANTNAIAAAAHPEAAAAVAKATGK